MKKLKEVGAKNDYVSKDEKYDKKAKKKLDKSMKTAGLATELKKASKGKDKMNGPKIKASMKGC